MGHLFGASCTCQRYVVLRRPARARHPPLHRPSAIGECLRNSTQSRRKRGGAISGVAKKSLPLGLKMLGSSGRCAATLLVNQAGLIPPTSVSAQASSGSASAPPHPCQAEQLNSTAMYFQSNCSSVACRPTPGIRSARSTRSVEGCALDRLQFYSSKVPIRTVLELRPLVTSGRVHEFVVDRPLPAARPAFSG